MDQKFLEEYEQEELETIATHNSVSDRIPELQTPIIYSRGIPGCTLWGQIPFSGTVIFQIKPLDKFVFEAGYNISVDSIPDLIKFAKETKKIFFVLSELPTEYLHYDYLQPFFNEIHPPCLYGNRNFITKDLWEIYDKSREEIEELVKFSPEHSFLRFITSGKSIINSYITEYSLLRYLGFEEVADKFIDNFLIEPGLSTEYLGIAYDLLAHPILDPFKATPMLDIQTLEKAHKFGLNHKTQNQGEMFPEIGSLFMKKLTYYPESLEACKQIISKYEQNDLYNVYSALNTAVNNRESTSIIQNKEELSEIIDNVWKEIKEIERTSRMYKYGIGVTCGMIGYTLAGVPGLLASLGLGKLPSYYLEEFSNLISKKAASPYLATIYDFQHKYQIKQ